jgi:membrane-associated phospholipid phosphatase
VRPSRVARLVTDVLAPGNVFIVLLLVVGWHSTGTAEGLAWGLMTAVICGGFPLGVVVLGVRRRWWTDVHVSVREQRFVPLAVAMASNLAGLGLMLAIHAPQDLIAMVATVLAGLAVGGIITVGWMVSGHTAVAAAAATVLTVAYGPWLLTAFLAVPVIGWSRVALRDHTSGQAAAGVLIGVLAVCAVFVPLRLPVADEQLPARIDHRRFTAAMRAAAGFARRVRPSRCGNRCRPTS